MATIRDTHKSAKVNAFEKYLRQAYSEPDHLHEIVSENLKEGSDPFRAFIDEPIIVDSFYPAFSEWMNENNIPIMTYYDNIQINDDIISDMQSEMFDQAKIDVTDGGMAYDRYARTVYKQIISSDEERFKSMDVEEFEAWLNEEFLATELTREVEQRIFSDAIGLTGVRVKFTIVYSGDYVNDILSEAVDHSGNGDVLIEATNAVRTVLENKYNDPDFAEESYFTHADDDSILELIYDATEDLIETYRTSTPYRFTKPRREMITDHIFQNKLYDTDVYVSDAIDYDELATQGLERLSYDDSTIYTKDTEDIQSFANSKLTATGIAGRWLTDRIEASAGASADIHIVWDESDFVEFCHINF